MALPLPGTPIIIDIGSAYVKIGFAGEPGPSSGRLCQLGQDRPDPPPYPGHPRPGRYAHSCFGGRGPVRGFGGP